MGQLTIDGGEEEVGAVALGAAPLSPAQRNVLQAMRDGDGTIRTVEAGVLVHDWRRIAARAAGSRASGCGFGARSTNFRGGGVACCAYAAPDGLEMMKRLAARGLVERTERRGVWRLRSS